MADQKQVVFDLERCTCHVPDACRDCSKYDMRVDSMSCMENLMMDALELLKEFAKDINAPDKWISVKDGKPPSIREPHYRDVFRPVFLYTEKDNSVYVGWYLGEDYRGIDSYICRTSMKSYQYITKKITHWMPLPEPPREDKKHDV